jgi:hypothetical protein
MPKYKLDIISVIYYVRIHATCVHNLERRWENPYFGAYNNGLLGICVQSFPRIRLSISLCLRHDHF